MSEITTIMTDDPTGSGLITFSKLIAENLVRNELTRSQIRGIFTEVRKIEAVWQSQPGEAMRRLNMLKPKLDYQAVRSAPVAGLRDVLSKAIDEVEKSPDQEERNKRFERFMDLFEAILAFHRAQGGRN